MIDIHKDTKVYIICPAYVKTGGPELLHQLANKLDKMGIDVTMAYYGTKEENKNYRNKNFDIYIDKAIRLEDIEDNENNLLIIPEVRLWFLKKFKKSRKCVWWLSVDGIYTNLGISNCIKTYRIKRTIKMILKNEISYSLNVIKKADYHLCQSKYAMEFLKEHNVKECEYLSDYLNKSYIENSKRQEEKENNVVYNPKKGIEFTKKLIERSPDTNWVPIINMTNEEVLNLLLKSKVYIDFGNHPGKDRIPREAAMCGCCIITGKRGSAKFYEDVPIKDDFKFEDKEENIDNILEKIKTCLENYEEQNSYFEDYRKEIIGEEEKFEKDIKKIFEIQT